MTLMYLLLLGVFSLPSSLCMGKSERAEMRKTVKDMFRHAYNSYMTNAYPADELMPLNCKGRYRGTEPSRGDVDDILGNFSMTLIDSLDSLVIFGEIDKFEEAVKLVIDNVHFDNDIVVSTFETNIRVLGGLLGGHVAADVLQNDGLAMDWYNDELLDMAKDIGERLMPAFNTTTGIPYPKVNLMYGVADPRSRTGTESATCTACAGTMIMEFGALSRLTGDAKFETAAHKAMKALWTYRSRSSDLVGTVINIHNGEWVRRDSGVGAGIDSYYEYCLKAYILLGEEDYLQRFNQHYKAVMRYINKDSLFLNVHMNNPSRSSVTYMDSLQAFWPGLQVLKGDVKSAIELHEVFYSVAKRHTFLPEAFTTNFEVHWGQHFLRPELVESTYFLYEATKDPYYLEVGKYIVENLNRYTRVPCGFAAVKDVRTLSHENRMDSFLLSETLKYLYLLFTDKEDLLINLQDFVFTTEAHILPLALSNWNGSSSQNNVYESENLHDHSCPRTAKEDSMMSFAEKIRQKSRQSKARNSCSKAKQKQTFVKSKSSAPLLRAEQFIPGNKDHLLILKAMGISVTKTDDGKVQLMQDASSADNTEMAAEGITFMQSMIELAKFRSNDAEYQPRVVQILSPPYNGNIVLNAGPAQFGIDLGKSGMGVSAEVILADPIKGCTELKNHEVADHRIVIMERGDCMFVDKVRLAESLGAVGAIIIDNNAGSSSESQPMFAMSGDGSSSNIKIPAVFLFSNEGEVLQKAMQIVSFNTKGNLRVRLGDKALKKDANKKQAIPSTDVTHTEGEDEITAEKTPELKQDDEHRANPQAVTSEDLENAANDDVNKLLELMKNVVKQPGFEFLTGKTQPYSKESLMKRDVNTADKRERWLYDAMMENWREKQQPTEKSECRSESVDEIVGKFQDGIFDVKTEKASSLQGQCGSGPANVATQKAGEDFVDTDSQHDSEIFVVGKVADETLPGEETGHSSHKHGGEKKENSESEIIQSELEKRNDAASREKLAADGSFNVNQAALDTKHGGDSSVDQVEGSYEQAGNHKDDVNENTNSVPSSEREENVMDGLGKSTDNTDSTRGDLRLKKEESSLMQNALKHQDESVNIIRGDRPINDNNKVGDIVYFSDCMLDNVHQVNQMKNLGNIEDSGDNADAPTSHDTHATLTKDSSPQVRDTGDTKDSEEAGTTNHIFLPENGEPVGTSNAGVGNEVTNENVQQGERTFDPVIEKSNQGSTENINPGSRIEAEDEDMLGNDERQDSDIGTYEKSRNGEDLLSEQSQTVSVNADEHSEVRNMKEIGEESTNSEDVYHGSGSEKVNLDDRTSSEKQNP